jgi:hypothetical protein
MHAHSVDTCHRAVDLEQPPRGGQERRSDRMHSARTPSTTTSDAPVAVVRVIVPVVVSDVPDDGGRSIALGLIRYRDQRPMPTPRSRRGFRRLVHSGCVFTPRDLRKCPGRRPEPM